MLSILLLYKQNIYQLTTTMTSTVEDLKDSHFIRNSILYMNDPRYSYILNNLDCEVIMCHNKNKYYHYPDIYSNDEYIHQFTFNNTRLFKWLKEISIHYVEVSKNVIISTHQYQIYSLIKDKNFDKLDTIHICSPTNLLVTNMVSKTFKKKYTEDFYKYLAHKINCSYLTFDLRNQIIEHWRTNDFKKMLHDELKIHFKQIYWG